MPLKFDSEFDRELKHIEDKALRGNKKFWWRHVLMAGSLLAAVVGGLHYAGASDGLAITTTLGVSALCVIVVINSGLMVVHGNLVLLIGATEWIGRKRLGEYEPPGGGGKKTTAHNN